MKCPVCFSPMVLFYLGEVELDSCPQCGGVFFDRGELKEVLEENLDILGGKWEEEEEISQFVWGRGGKEKDCPRCGEKMMLFSYSFSPYVYLDVCPFCGGTWLDGGELGEVVRSLPYVGEGRSRASLAALFDFPFLWKKKLSQEAPLLPFVTLGKFFWIKPWLSWSILLGTSCWILALFLWDVPYFAKVPLGGLYLNLLYFALLGEVVEQHLGRLLYSLALLIWAGFLWALSPFLGWEEVPFTLGVVGWGAALLGSFWVLEGDRLTFLICRTNKVSLHSLSFGSLLLLWLVVAFLEKGLKVPDFWPLQWARLLGFAFGVITALFWKLKRERSHEVQSQFLLSRS